MAERSFKVKLEAEYQAFVQAMEGAAKSTEKVGDAAEKAGARAEKAHQRQTEAAAKVRVAEAQLAEAKAKGEAGSARVIAAEEKVTSARREQEKATEEVVAAEKSHRDALAAASAEAENSTSTMGRLADSADKNRQAWDRAGTALTAFGAITTVALGATVKAAMDWESAWTGVLKTADGSGAQLAALEGDLRNLAKTLPATHQEIAAVAEAAGQLGVGVDSVASFTKTMIDLGETTNLSADEAATAIAQMANVMDPKLLTSSDGVSRFGATLVALGNDGASTEKQILEMAQRISGSGKLVGASEAEVLALSNALASMGITAELGGGVVSRILQDIYSAVKSGGPQLEQFARLAGQSADEFAKSFANDPVRALDAVAQGLNGVDASGGNVVATLTDLGFKSSEEQRVLLQLKGAGDLLTDSLDLANVAWAENSALIEEASKRYDTAEAKVQIAQNSIKDAAITIGDALLPAVAAGAEGVADLANWFGALPAPAQQAVGAIGGLVGVTALAAGGFLLLFPRAMETVTALRELGIIGPRTTAALGKVGKAAGMAGAALAVGYLTAHLVDLLDANDPVALSVAETTKALLAMKSAADANALFELGSGVDDINTLLRDLTGENLLGKMNQFGQSMDGMFGTNIMSGQNAGKEQLEALGQSLATLVQSGHIDLAKQQFDLLYSSVDSTRYSTEELRALMPAYGDALAEVDNQQTLAAGSAEGLAGGLDSIDPATKAATEALEAWTKMVSDADASFSDIGGAYQGVIDKNKEVAQATADSTKSSKDSWEDFYDGASVSMDDWIAKLEEQAQAQKNWQDNILTITSEIRQQMPADMVATADAMIDELIALGEAGAPALQTFREASAEERIRLVEAWSGTGFEIADEFASGVESARNPSVSIEADGTLAAIELAQLLGQIESASGLLTIDGDDGPATEILEGATAAIDQATGTVTIYGNDGQALTTLGNYTATVDKSTGTVVLRGNDAQGRATTVSLTNWVGLQGASVKVDANTSSAASTIAAFIANQSGQRIPVYFDAKQGTQITRVGLNALAQANGGVVDFFANGAENHVAQIAPGGSWRVWAEPETEGEAYIPLAPSKRARSQSILENVADRFGYETIPKSRNYAHGGLDNAPAYTPSRAVSAAHLTQQVNVNPIVNLDGAQITAMFDGIGPLTGYIQDVAQDTSVKTVVRAARDGY